MTGQTSAKSARAKPAVTPGAAETTYTISDLAKEFAVTTRTIRFYESRGLIQPQRIGTSRRYSKRDRARLMLILRGRNLGFTVEDVGQYLALYDADPGQQAQTALLLDKVSAAIADLEKKRDDLSRALSDLADIRSRCEQHLIKRGRAGP
jgi:DNA-binding transcriptional MerR regulator